jgi:hypothetical protein
MDQGTHNAAAHASWWISQRLLSLLVEKELLTHHDVIQLLSQGIKALEGGGPTNRATAVLLEQIKTYHEKATGLAAH